MRSHVIGIVLMVLIVGRVFWSLEFKQPHSGAIHFVIELAAHIEYRVADFLGRKPPSVATKCMGRVSSKNSV